MPYRRSLYDKPGRESHWRAEEDERAERARGEPSEAGRYSSDQARYFGADTRSFAPPLHRPQATPPSWRRNRFEAGREEPPFVYDEQDALTRGYYSLDGPHGGQEFGVEPHGYSERLVRRRPPPRAPASEAEEAPYGDQPLDIADPGVREFGPPADYAYHPKLSVDFEADYLDWRDERLRAHDQDYAAWRAEQQQRYDRDYRAFRSEGRSRLDHGFEDWRRRRADRRD